MSPGPFTFSFPTGMGAMVAGGPSRDPQPPVYEIRNLATQNLMLKSGTASAYSPRSDKSVPLLYANSASDNPEPHADINKMRVTSGAIKLNRLKSSP